MSATDKKEHRGRQLSQLISFLDCFDVGEWASSSDDGKDGKDSPTSSPATIDTTKLNRFQDDFLAHSLTSIESSLQSVLKVSLHPASSTTIQLVSSSSSTTPLTKREVQKLVVQAEELLEKEWKEKKEKKEALFPYQAEMEEVLKMSVKALSKIVGDNVPGLAEKLADTKIVSIVPTGDDFMVQYEVSFQTNFADKQIAFPNPDTLNDAHLQFIMDEYQLTRKSKGRILRDIYFWIYDRTCHEVFHLLQGLAKQQDKNPRGWSSEHDASICAYSLLWAIAQEKENAHLFSPGFVSEVLAKTIGDDAALAKKWTADENKEFEKWRDGFGLSYPSDDVIGERNALVSSFCGGISSQFFTTDVKTVQTITNLLFKDRTGDVAKITVKATTPTSFDDLLKPPTTSSISLKRKE